MNYGIAEHSVGKLALVNAAKVFGPPSPLPHHGLTTTQLTCVTQHLTLKDRDDPIDTPQGTETPLFGG
jgi:hypothetical protein